MVSNNVDDDVNPVLESSVSNNDNIVNNVDVGTNPALSLDGPKTDNNDYSTL